MKLTMKLLVLFFGVLLLANAANAESPREQLKQMVEQLQKTPNDNALRDQIIKLAQELKPAPAVPEEAERFEGRAQFAFKNAKSPADYLDAAREYEKAVTAAPWVAGYYADLCTIYEKAEKYAEAKKNCEFFLASSPSAQDASDVRKRIAGLEFAMEKAASQKNRGEEFLRKLDGARFVISDHANYMGGGSADWRDIYTVRGNRVYKTRMIDADSSGTPAGTIVQWGDKNGYIIVGREFSTTKDDDHCKWYGERCFDEIQTISENGDRIIERHDYRGKLNEKIYLREK